MSLFPHFHEVTPLFRLMDEYDRSTRDTFNQLRTFTPKFDIKETPDTYELQGELPGIDQKDVTVEWTDGDTITVSGRTESVREEGSRVALDGEDKQSNVQDKGKDAGTTTAVARQGSKEVGQLAKPKYWATERSVGELHRSFTFPTRVDQDAVKASLKNGVLSLVVPKVKAERRTKVNIELDQ